MFGRKRDPGSGKSPAAGQAWSNELGDITAETE